MAPTLGFTAILLIIALSLFLPVFNFYAQKFSTNVNAATATETSLCIIFFIFVLSIFAQFCLIYSYVISDYSVLNVYQNSHHLKPLFYKISGAWGNHEGSMLLLLSALSAYSLAFALIDKSEYKNLTLATQSLIIFGIASFTAATSNPFLRIFPAAESGLGLNPLLQDVGLAFHPPMLYAGYIGFSLVFSLAVAALLKEKVTADFFQIMRFWLILSWGFLTIGVGLGAWWAYRELGWGGYWFWDPVENVSLMPWLAATTLLHALKLRQGKGPSWAIFMALLSFTMCLIGIFLVRSGLLTSVHSFAVDAKRGFFIILLISIISGAGMLIFANKINKLQNLQTLDANLASFSIFSRLGTLVINNYLLTIALFTVFLGTLYPVLSQNLFGQAISVGANYYNKIMAILTLPFLIFLTLSYFSHHSQGLIKAKIITKSTAFILLASLLITIFVILQKKPLPILEITLLFTAIFSTFLSALAKKNAANLAHTGFTLVIIGVILSSLLGVTKELNVKQGEIITLDNHHSYSIKFENVEYLAGANFLARQANFIILQNNKTLTTLKPQLRYYPVSDQTTNEAAIFHQLTGDLYLAIGNKDENDFYALRIYFKPFIYLLWLGCLLMFAAAILKVLQLYTQSDSKLRFESGNIELLRTK